MQEAFEKADNKGKLDILKNHINALLETNKKLVYETPETAIKKENYAAAGNKNCTMLTRRSTGKRILEIWTHEVRTDFLVSTKINEQFQENCKDFKAFEAFIDKDHKKSKTRYKISGYTDNIAFIDAFFEAVNATY